MEKAAGLGADPDTPVAVLQQSGWPGGSRQEDAAQLEGSFAGILQELLGTAKPREVPPVMNGPPNGPTGLRVSATRHGATGTKRSPGGGPPMTTVTGVAAAEV